MEQLIAKLHSLGLIDMDYIDVILDLEEKMHTGDLEQMFKELTFLGCVYQEGFIEKPEAKEELFAILEDAYISLFLQQ